MFAGGVHASRRGVLTRGWSARTARRIGLNVRWSVSDYAASKIPAAPIPPPMHIVTIP